MTKSYDVVVIGTGMGSLTAASLLAKEGLQVLALEQNYLPGGCTSAYWRKGFVFESGATTLVGLDETMPLRHLLDTLGLTLAPIRLGLPMQVHLKDGTVVNRYEDLEAWIAEAERVFGVHNQRPFWTLCYQISQFVWETSMKQTAFPPRNLRDLWLCARRATLKQFRFARYAFTTVEDLLRRFGLLSNARLVEFVNEQLLITAQNYLAEVNMLFGATALCYTNFGNYYMPGGLINLVNPLIAYIEEKGGQVHLREGVQQIDYQQGNYQIRTNKDTYTARFLVSGIPLNNTLELYDNGYGKAYKRQLMDSSLLNSAFQVGIGFDIPPNQPWESIHHQIHLPVPLLQIGSHSIFVSLSHPEDPSRCDQPNQRVASVSTHIPHPAQTVIHDTQAIVQYILDLLIEKGFFRAEDIVYTHASAQQSWQKWTGRAFGFVGGYPQLKRVKPWQMVEARLDGKKAYLCGDTTYPGQGIPGTVLSGIIAAEKLRRDWL